MFPVASKPILCLKYRAVLLALFLCPSIALATFSHGDALKADLSAATVVTLYLLPEVNIALKPKLLKELSPGARVISGNFDMGRWVPDRHQVSQSIGGIYLWHLPLEMPPELLH